MNKSGQGFITFAENTQEHDYLSFALLQAKLLKESNPTSQYAIIVNDLAFEKINDDHKKYFDHIIRLEEDWNESTSSWKLQNESQVFQLTPFKETIKLESDLIIHKDISHWWSALRLRDIIISTGSVNYFGETNHSNNYREFFRINDLPDVYNGLMYFRFSETAYKFFETAKTIRKNWLQVSKIFKKCNEPVPSTDTLYAITARLFGEDLVTLPTLKFFRFCHMKAAHNNFPEGEDWWEYLLFEKDGSVIRINNERQYYPLHYQNKKFLEYYERNY